MNKTLKEAIIIIVTVFVTIDLIPIILNTIRGWML